MPTPHHQVGIIYDNDAHVPAVGVRGHLLSRHRVGRFFADGGQAATAPSLLVRPQCLRSTAR